MGKYILQVLLSMCGIQKIVKSGYLWQKQTKLLSFPFSLNSNCWQAHELQLPLFHFSTPAYTNHCLIVAGMHSNGCKKGTDTLL